MSRIDVLIASELPLHREVLAATFRALRPELVVRAVAHDDLNRVICELRPLLVINSAGGYFCSPCTMGWISLYPDDRDEAIIFVGDERRIIPNASIHHLLGVMDDLRSSR